MNGDSINGVYLVLSACTFYIVGIIERAMITQTTLINCSEQGSGLERLRQLEQN